MGLLNIKLAALKGQGMEAMITLPFQGGCVLRYVTQGGAEYRLPWARIHCPFRANFIFTNSLLASERFSDPQVLLIEDF